MQKEQKTQVQQTKPQEKIEKTQKTKGKKQVQRVVYEPGVYVKKSEEEKKVMLAKLIQQGKQNRHQVKYFQQITKPHSFWDTQPTVKWDNKVEKSGPVHEPRTVADVRKQPVDLPQGLQWCQINLTAKDGKDLDEFYTLLTQNYVEDEDGTFRFDYSKEFLRWALTPPTFNSKWIVGVRNKVGGELVASITGIPVSLIVQGTKIQMGEINFLCANKNLRAKKLAPILISEVTRRINQKDKWQAIYTAGRVLPTPFCQTTYWHRSLNPVKLVDIRFSGMGPNMTKARMAKLYKLPETNTVPAFRPMTKKDVTAVYKFINAQLQKYVVKFHFSQQQVRHFFLPIPKVIVTYVIGTSEQITDLFSFYSLPSHVMKNDKHNMLHACYSYYNFATTIPYEQLILNALITANNLQYDVYNCLDIMNNKEVFENLHFMIGDGHLNYYLYNWGLSRQSITPQELSTVLV